MTNPVVKSRNAQRKFLRNCTMCVATAAFSLTSLSCGRELLKEDNAAENHAAARLSGEALFSTTYEVEEYTATQILSKFPEGSRDKAFAEIAAQPRLERQRIEFKLFADGNYELVSTQLRPSRVDLLPASIRDRREESGLAHKTVLRGGTAHFYDLNGKEVGSTELKNDRYAVLADRILKAGEVDKEQVASEIIGHPLINEKLILGQATEKQAEIRKDRGITKIRYDLSKFAAESNENVENLSKYAVQYYDFKNRRLVGETLWDKKSNALIYSSMIAYSAVDKGNQIEKILSETFDENPDTGVKTRLVKETYYSNMTTQVNRR